MLIRLSKENEKLLQDMWVESNKDINSWINNQLTHKSDRVEKWVVAIYKKVEEIYNEIKGDKKKASWLSRWLTQKQIDYANSIINNIRSQYKEDEWWWILPDNTFTSKWYHLIDSSVTWELYEYIKKNI